MSGRRRGPGRPRVNQEEAEGGDPNVNLMTQMMQQQAMQHQQMMQMMQQQMHQQAQSQQQWAQMMQQGQGLHPQHPPPPVVGNPAFREYNRNHPPEFNGEGGPQEAKRWLKQMEKIFRMAECSDADKVVYATNQFRGAAEDWWETAQRRMLANDVEINWDNFKEALLEKYLPLSFKVQKEHEFLELRQGNMSVTEFTKKFEELSHYSTHNEYETNEIWKINQYKRGLRGEIDTAVGQQKYTCFDDLVHNRLVAETGFAKTHREKSLAFEKRKDKYHQQLKPKGSPQKGKQTQSTRPYPTCKTCGRSHKGECMKGSGICYGCHQPGHFITECPNRSGKGVAGGTTTSKGRVYTLDGKKAQTNTDLIADLQVSCSKGKQKATD